MSKRRHWWARRRSQSISEYAILVAVIIAFVLVGSTGLTTALRSVTENVLGNDYAPPPPPASPSPSPTPPPVADFSGTPTSGSAPLTVAFTDASTNSPTSWSWTFGDGGVSTAQNPSYTYTTPGTYNVSLTVFNGSGSDTITKVNYITVGPPPPVADFSGTPTTGYIPLTVNFTDLSTGGTPTAWSWDFGDSGTATTQNPSHTYSTPGTYDVALTASNASGSNTATKPGYITALAPTVRWVSKSADGCTSNNVTVPAGGTVSPGDLLVVYATTIWSPTTITSPSGFTLVENVSYNRVWYKTATGTETSITLNNACRVIYAAIATSSLSFSSAARSSGFSPATVPQRNFSKVGVSVVWMNTGTSSSSSFAGNKYPTIAGYSTPVGWYGTNVATGLWFKFIGAAGANCPCSITWPSTMSGSLYYADYGQVAFVTP
jgi:PKD repeat protein